MNANESKLKASKATFILLAVTALLAITGCSSQVPNSWNQVKNISYVEGSQLHSQTLDLYLPQPEAGSQLPPLIVYIHGGGWISGDKTEHPPGAFSDSRYAWASINYRLSSEAIFPAQIEDCRRAIQWLRAHSSTYHFDGNRIGVWGHSAGGHLAALLGTTGGAKDDASKIASDGKVQAVCDWCGPSDFITIQHEAEPGNRLEINNPHGPIARLLGGLPDKRKELAQQASPCRYASVGDPPFLIMHGDADDMVPLQQSQELYEALQSAHVESQLIAVKGAGHSLYSPEALAIVTRFFDKTLLKKSNNQSTQK